MQNKMPSGSRSNARWRWALITIAVALIAVIVALSVLRNSLNFGWLSSPLWGGVQGIAAVIGLTIVVYEYVRRRTPQPPTDRGINEVAQDSPTAHSPQLMPTTIAVPPPPVDFVDREQVIDDCVAYLIGTDGVRALALIGFGGLGKSSVAEKVVETLREGPNRQRFSVISWHQCDDITGIEGWARLLDEVARRHGRTDITEYADVQAKEGIVTELLAGKDSLLILDNVEEKFPLDRAMRVLTVRGKDGIGPSVLMTSRYALVHPNLRTVELDVLPVSDGKNLFMQRVKSVSDGAVVINASEIRDVERICVAVGYLPLGIELAAVVVGRRMGTVSALADQLSRSGSAQAADTFQKLYSTFTASYDPLPSAQRYAFAACSMFEGADFPIQAADQVAGAAQQIAHASQGGVLRALFDHSLVQSFRSEGEVRCRLHPLLKQFAQQKLAELAEDVRQTLTRAVIEYFAARTSTSADQSRARGRDYLNYVGAIALAHEQNEWWADVHLCEAMGNYWYISGQWYDGRRYLQLGVLAARQIGSKQSESRFLVELGRIHEEQGDVEDAKDALQRALALLQDLDTDGREQDVEHGIVDTLLELGRLNDKQGNYDPLHRFQQTADKTAKEWLTECLERARACGYAKAEGSALHELGVVAIHVGNYDEAYEWLTQALAVRTANRDQRGIGRTNHQFGRLYNRRADQALRLGDKSQAEEYNNLAFKYLSKALTIAHDEGDQRGYSHTLREIGILYRRQGRRGEARQVLVEALDISHRLGDKLAEGQVHEELCKLALDDGRNDIAEQEARQAYVLLQAANARPQLANVTELILQHGWPVPVNGSTSGTM